MKNLFHVKACSILTAICAIFMLPSCEDSIPPVNPYYPNALVTAKVDSNDIFYLQLNDKTTLFPVNVRYSPYRDKEVRALVSFYEVDQESYQFDKAVYLNWIDSIRTKNTVPDLGKDNDKEYGSDPVEIVNDWVTVAEDGYLTLRFRTMWGYRDKIHYVNLVTGVNPENPYEVEFHHNANGDYSGQYGDALVAFNLKDMPSTDGKLTRLKLKWNSFSGPKSTEFNFMSRENGDMEIYKLEEGESFINSVE